MSAMHGNNKFTRQCSRLLDYNSFVSVVRFMGLDQKLRKRKMVRVKTIGGFWSFVILLWWISGIYYSEGFWGKLTTICFPPYAMYVTVAHVLEKYEH